MPYFERNGEKVYIHGYLKQGLDLYSKNLTAKGNLDAVLIVDGYEGTGKSTMAFTMAAYIDPTFSLKRVCFDAKTFYEATNDAKRGQAVVFDEGFRGFYSKEGTGKMNIMLEKMLAEVRQRNLFLIIVMPSFFLLSKYVALHRGLGLVHTFMRSSFRRGYFSFYSARKKTMLYKKGRDLLTYKPVAFDFRGNFVNWLPFDEDEYKKKKSESYAEIMDGAMNKTEKVAKEKNQKWALKFRRLDTQRDLAIALLLRFTPFSKHQICSIIDANMPGEPPLLNPQLKIGVKSLNFSVTRFSEKQFALLKKVDGIKWSDIEANKYSEVGHLNGYEIYSYNERNPQKTVKKIEEKEKNDVD